MNAFLKGLETHLSWDQMEKISAARIGIAGAGGLGSNCAAHLVRSGFSDLFIADFDRVDASNLNRQFFFADQVGRKKTDALRDNLLRINPDADISTMDVKLDQHGLSTVFNRYPIVIEALDRAEDKVMMAHAFAGQKKLFISVSGIGGWGDSDRIRVRKIGRGYFIVGDMVSGVGPEMPPTAAIVSIAAAKQADLVLSHVLGESCHLATGPPAGKK